MTVIETTDLTIRKADEGDVVLLSVLASTTFYEAYFEQDESHNLAAYIYRSFEPEHLRTEFDDPSSTFFIAEVNGRAVGYARLIAGSTAESVTGDAIIELKRFYVLERLWKAGVGRQLLEHCLRYSRQNGFDTLWLGVWEENIRAQRFYSKFGFRQVGTLLFPYGDVEGTNLVLQTDL